MELLRQIDETLLIILEKDKNGFAGNKSINEITFRLMKNKIELTMPLSDILDKLLEDGFIITFQMDVVKNGITNPLVDHYTPTFKGFFFRESQKGYRKKYRRQAYRDATVVVLNWSVAVAGGVAAVYYLFAILKLFHLFPFCNLS